MLRLSLCLSLLLGLGCATERAQRPAEQDPSNPDAPEAASPLVAEPPLVHAPPDAGTPGAAVYTCPMHPEVRSDRPGRCPKCGMQLVPVSDDTHGAHAP